MVGDRIVGVEGGNGFLGALEEFLVFLFLLVHFLLVLFLLSFDLVLALLDHVYDVSGLFVDDPAVLDLFWLEFVAVFLQ